LPKIGACTPILGRHLPLGPNGEQKQYEKQQYPAQLLQKQWVYGKSVKIGLLLPFNLLAAINSGKKQQI
jgi:hypothetical protein